MTKRMQAQLAWMTSAILAAGCSGGGGGGEDADDDAPDPLVVFYETMQENAEAFAFTGGDWTEDMGDAPFYGTGFYSRAGAEYARADYTATAATAVEYDVSLIQRAATDFAWFVENFEEVVMAGLGLIEYADQTGDEAFLADLETVIDNTNDLLALYGDYLDVDMESYALDTYGPTTVTAAAALLDLQYATYLSTGLRQSRIDRAVEIVAAIDENAYQGSWYIFSPDAPRLDLYPNVMMILVLARLHELTGEASYLAVAEGLYDAIQTLKRPERGNYYSEYSAAYMGATTEDYSTLSSHNYLVMALVILYLDTGHDEYRIEARSVLDFIRLYIYDADQGRILHHWIDGHIAQPADPEYFCSGCNLQFLYVVWYLLSRAEGG